ncbi:MAG: hypothetical protein AB201_01315 [Parcubacteria bacterium C7867-006]|nr:MAG: hypothetical protein AB201_01315 [Parcubacteria bacterium C7867-006]
MQSTIDFIKKYQTTILWVIFIFVATGAIEFFSGRSVLGPDGMFGWWEGSVWSAENSQRVADAYTFSHIIHGMLFYAFLWLVVRKVPVKYRFIFALAIEAGWELLENSPIVIDRYRAVTISLGYVGDSVLNSLSDIMFAGIGFMIAKYSKFWVSVFLIIAMELGCLFWVRDNLTLNVLMLLYPIKTVQVWQSVGHV